MRKHHFAGINEEKHRYNSSDDNESSISSYDPEKF